MGIIKDWCEDEGGSCFRYRVINFLSPRVWLRLHKWRKQRANRGWSDRDTWGAGDHIAQITAEMLQHLNDYAYTDWPDWFKFNVEEKGSYKNLQSIIDDINGYLKNQEVSWSDGLDIAEISADNITEEHVYLSPGWVNQKTGKKLTEKQITARIHKWGEENNRLYKKATKAMSFFARHFSSFWD